MKTNLGLLGALTGLALVAGLAGCRSMPSTSSDDTPYGPLMKMAQEITRNGGLAAVGTGLSVSPQLAIEKAKTHARQELAQMLEVKVESMRKSFMEESGQGKSGDFNAMFTSVGKVVASQVLRGTSELETKYNTTKGVTTAWTVMAQNPKLISDAFEAEMNQQKAAITRFRASQAFAELAKEIQAFEAYKKEQGAAMALP